MWPLSESVQTLCPQGLMRAFPHPCTLTGDEVAPEISAFHCPTWEGMSGLNCK